MEGFEGQKGMGDTIIITLKYKDVIKSQKGVSNSSLLLLAV